eukprot:UN05855
MMRENAIKQWKIECNNTARMALWLKFRIDAAKNDPKSDDAKRYRAYKRMEARERQKWVEKKYFSHDEWTLDQLYKEAEPDPSLKHMNIDSEYIPACGDYIEWVDDNNPNLFHCSAKDLYLYKKGNQWFISRDDPRANWSNPNVIP